MITLHIFTGVSKTAAESHRLYDLEVIDLGHDVSFILVLPPVSDVCRAPGLTTDVLEPKVPFKTLPVQVFEICKYKVLQIDTLK